MQPFTSHKIPGSFQKIEYILYLEKLGYNFLFLIVLKARASFLFLCYASILKWFRHSCNRCLNSNQILLIDPLPFHSFLNLNTELLLHAWLHFPKFTCSWVIKYYIEFWAYVVESLQIMVLTVLEFRAWVSKLNKIMLRYEEVERKSRLVRHLILLQTHKCSLLIMGLHIFEIELC